MEIIQALPTKFVCQLTVVLSDKIQIIEVAVPSGRTSLPFAAVSSANVLSSHMSFLHAFVIWINPKLAEEQKILTQERSSPQLYKGTTLAVVKKIRAFSNGIRTYQPTIPVKRSNQQSFQANCSSIFHHLISWRFQQFHMTSTAFYTAVTGRMASARGRWEGERKRPSRANYI